MPKIPFSKVPDAQDFSPLPEGKYLCRLEEITPANTQLGDEMWKLKFEVIDGDYVGRHIFDNMVFSKAALPRVKLMCSRLGMDTSQDQDFEPDDIEGKSCWVIVEVEDYEDQYGKPKKRNKVPFAGYEKISKDSVPDGEDLPF